MVLSPFSRRDNQRTFSIFTIIISLLIVMVSAPFSVKFGGYTIGSTILGGVFFIIALIYFIDVYS